jgi:pimeloyl-ACP methyl ester carboxylesterase
MTHPDLVKRLGLVGAAVVSALLVLLAARPGLGQMDSPLYLPIASRPCPTAAEPQSDNWLAWVNYYRATACLLPVVENAAWSAGDYKHAIYIVKNDELQHTEAPSNRWYTPEGRTAAENSNLAGSNRESETDRWAIDTWMQAPFHALGILDPHLTAVGYGSYREGDGGIEMGAALDVLSGFGLTPLATYPVMWPGSGATVPIRQHWGETPNPLTSCPGYKAKTGLPVILLLGRGDVTPSVTATAFTHHGQPLQHCVFDETNYRNSDAAEQEIGRSILAVRDAIVIIPRKPLEAGQMYGVSITTNGQTYTWSFSVSDAPRADAAVDSSMVP